MARPLALRIDVDTVQDNHGPHIPSKAPEQLLLFPCSKVKLDQLFLQWMCLPESQELVTKLIDDVQAGRPIKGPALPSLAPALSPLGSGNAMFSATPPLSPSKGRSPRSPASSLEPKKSGHSTPVAVKRPLSNIPQFYNPSGPALSEEALSRWRSSVEAAFSGRTGATPGAKSAAAVSSGGGGQALGAKAFVSLLSQLHDLPCMLGHVLFKALLKEQQAGGAAGGAAAGTPSPGALGGGGKGKAAGLQSVVLKETFVRWWTGHKLVDAHPAKRLFDILLHAGGGPAQTPSSAPVPGRQGAQGQQPGSGVPYLTHRHFQPLMDAVLEHHPGLEFLRETPEFQRRYCETVIYRIFYSLNRLGSGRLTLREIKRHGGELLSALAALDKEEDINRVLRFFSYEHFYVIYCKFWELDADHDFLIDKQDLAHYGQCSLSFAIVERLFQQAARPFGAVANSKNPPGKMGYEDFVWFILSEEDKNSHTALEYWFAACDLDGDGVIRPAEMWAFFEEQVKRLDGFSAEPVLFEDVVCQLHDMLQPAQEGGYTLADLRRARPASALLFNALFNLSKFLGFENRDPFAARAGEAAAGGEGLTDWDKFARVEYLRLADEEEGEEADVGMDARAAGGRGYMN